MERRKALALAGASTLVLGSAVVALASVGGSFLGFGSGDHDGVGSFTAPPTIRAAKRHVTVRARDVYDRYVIDVGGESQRTAKRTTTTPVITPAVIAAPLDATPTTVLPPAPDNDEESGSSHSTPTTVDDPPARPTPTTGITPTTRPRGVPDDWPAGKPIPPMPANCHQPQLEDNGVWNCQRSDDDDD